MNRAQRRREEREAARRRTIEVPDGTLVSAHVLTGLGRVEEVTNYKAMPAKRPGVHRWQAFIVHSLGEEQAEAWAKGGGQVLLDPSTIVTAMLGCIDCEGTYEETAGRPCPAGDEWRTS